MIQATDLCYTNTRVDYHAMHAAGVGLAYLKIAQGGVGVDKQFMNHKSGCKGEGVPWGPYFFCDYRISGDANAQTLVDAVDKTGGEWGNAPLMFDEEYEEVLGWGRPPATAMLRVSLDFYAELGRLTGKDRGGDLFYSNPDTFVPMAQLSNIRQLTSHPLAVAHYGAKMPTIGPWKNWTLWQYAGDVAVSWSAPEPGISAGKVDLIWFNGDEAELAAFLNQPAPVVVSTMTRDQCIDDLLHKNGYTWS